ncbi:hypothetical protein Goarm_023302, partial [Gossypium armourianum]|nr:hypothetical protein [Gossypium armourianum]
DEASNRSNNDRYYGNDDDRASNCSIRRNERRPRERRACLYHSSYFGLAFEERSTGDLRSFPNSSVVNFQVMRTTLVNVWQPIGGVSISDLGEGRFLFQFYLEVDVDRIEKDRPWNFNSHILILHRLMEGENPLGVELNWVDFLVLVYDISYGFMSEIVAKQLSNFIGIFLEYDVTTFQAGSKRVMRIWVRMNVRKPLQRRKRFTLPNGVCAYAHFEYEKLMLFCFLCGKLGHRETFCPLQATILKHEIMFQWDLTLCALSRKAAIWMSKWLVEDGNGGGPNFRNISISAERSEIEETSDCSSSPACAKRHKSLCSLFIETKPNASRMDTKDKCKVYLRPYSRRHIDVMMEDDGKGQTWRYTGFYRALEERLREELWNLLRQLNDLPNVLWMVIGDFNETVYLTEKKRGLPHRE